MSLRMIIALVGSAALLSVVAAADASTPGSNGRLVFSQDTGAGAQLFTMRSDGSGVRQVTHVDGDAVAPDWSPDGSWIVFELDADHAGIAIIRSGGSGLRDLTPTGLQSQPVFTPDGRSIVFDRFMPSTGDDSIWTMRSDGSGQRRLTRNPFPGQGGDPTVRACGMLTHYRDGEINAFTGSYSPDGRWIAYRLDNHGKYSLSKIRTYGVLAQPIRRFAEAPRYIDWGTNPG